MATEDLVEDCGRVGLVAETETSPGIEHCGDVKLLGTFKSLSIKDSHTNISVCSPVFSPFLFIRGLSCPRSVQTSLTQNCLQLTIPGLPYNLLLVSCGDIGFIKKLHWSSIGLDIRLKSAFSALRALLPCVNYSAK